MYDVLGLLRILKSSVRDRLCWADIALSVLFLLAAVIVNLPLSR